MTMACLTTTYGNGPRAAVGTQYLSHCYYGSVGWYSSGVSSPMFERYMTRLVVVNGHQKDKCYNKNGLCAQNFGLHSRFSSEHHHWEGAYVIT